MNFTDVCYYDAKEILCEQYQRPYQYLVRLLDPTAVMDKFIFVKSDITNDVKSFLTVVLRLMWMLLIQ